MLNSQESNSATCLVRIGLGRRLIVGVTPAGRLSTGGPAQFCDPGHKTTCLGSLRVPKREKVSDLREKARLQVIPRPVLSVPNYRLARFGIRDGHCFRADLTRFVRTRAFVTEVGSSPLCQLKEAMTLLTVNVLASRDSEVKHGRYGRRVGHPSHTKPNFLENPLHGKIVSQHFRGDAT